MPAISKRWLTAAFAQRAINFGGVIAALAADQNLAVSQRFEIAGILQRGILAAFRRGLASGIGGGEKHTLQSGEVALLTHASHEDAAHHTSPTDKSDT